MKRAYYLMHLAILLWGFTGIFGKAISMNEGMIVWYRMVLSAAALWIYISWKKKSWILFRRDIPKILLISLAICLHWLTFYGAIKASNVSVALACLSSITLFTSVLEPIFDKSKHHLSELFLGAGVMAGIYFIFQFQQLFFTGIVLAVVSALLASVFTILNKKMMIRYPAETITFFELGIGFIILTFLLPVYFMITNQTFQFPDSLDWIYLLLLSVFCTTIAFTISMEALKKVKAFTMNLSVNLEPVYSIVLAIIIFKEHRFLNSGFYLGAAIIISSVMIHTFYTYKMARSKKKRAEPPAFRQIN